MKLRRGSATFSREWNGYDYDVDAEFTSGEGWRLMGPATFDDRVYQGALSGKPVIYTSRRSSGRSLRTLNAEKQTGKVMFAERMQITPGSIAKFGIVELVG